MFLILGLCKPMCSYWAHTIQLQQGHGAPDKFNSIFKMCSIYPYTTGLHPIALRAIRRLSLPALFKVGWRKRLEHRSCRSWAGWFSLLITRSATEEKKGGSRSCSCEWSEQPGRLRSSSSRSSSYRPFLRPTLNKASRLSQLMIQLCGRAALQL